MGIALAVVKTTSNYSSEEAQNHTNPMMIRTIKRRLYLSACMTSKIDDSVASMSTRMVVGRQFSPDVGNRDLETRNSVRMRRMRRFEIWNHMLLNPTSRGNTFENWGSIIHQHLLTFLNSFHRWIAPHLPLECFIIGCALTKVVGLSLASYSPYCV